MKKKRFYLTSEVEEILGISRRTLFNYEKQGKIPKTRKDLLSGYRIYTEEDIEKIKKITGRD